MESSKKSIFMSILFLAVLISLIIGGQIYVSKLQKGDKAKSEKHVSNNDFRLDKKKDYIYYENEKVISDEPEIVFTDVIINLKGADVINASLKSEMDSIRNSVVLLNDNNKDANKELKYSKTNIFEAIERDYQTYEYLDYLSLVISDVNFNCYDDFSPKSVKGYVILKSEGKILTDDEILKKYDITKDDIKTRISAFLDEEILVKGENIIKKEDTLNELYNNYAFYIKSGDLYISFIVKTNLVDYNENVKVN